MTEPQTRRAKNAVPLMILGLALWAFGGLFAVYGPEGSSLGVVLGLAGVAALVTGIVLRVTA